MGGSGHGRHELEQHLGHLAKLGCGSVLDSLCIYYEGFFYCLWLALSGKKKITQPLGLKKNHATSWAKKNQPTSWAKKNHATSWAEGYHATNKAKKNHATSWPPKKSCKLLGQKKLRQPLGPKKYHATFRAKKNHATSRDMKKSRNLSGHEKITQPIIIQKNHVTSRQKKSCNLLKLKKNQATSWHTKKIMPLLVK